MPDASTTTPRGIFLSYAREDSAAALRIASALRGFGLEVWFDQSELRGGDVWDAKIKRQIRECALFIPVISAHTQAREEGYFRREWLLAVERKRDMAESRAFLVPVIVDDTKESDAIVPEQFLKAHCTRLPGGEPTPQFVEQIKRLLQGSKLPEPTANAPAATPLAGPDPRARPHRLGRWAGVAGALLLGLGVWFSFRPAPPKASAPGSPPPPGLPAQSQQDDKSIAVLPFVNMSAEKEQEYFADGISEELLNQLAKIPQLRVIARTSSFAYKGKEVGIAQIAAELKVAHVLEGSIRKSGNKVRITAQLIRTADSSHLWSETYDRSLEDIFSVQDEIAAAVVRQLRVTLLGEAPRARVANPRAYPLYLQAHQLAFQYTREGVARAQQLYEEALQIDPGFADAWVGLGDCYLLQASDGTRLDREGKELAAAAAAKAQAIDPDSAKVHTLLGILGMLGGTEDQTAAAAAHFERALALEPTSTDIMSKLMNFLRNLGRFDEAVALGEYVTAHDPIDSFGHSHLGAAYARVGRYEEAIGSLRTALSLSPGRSQTHYSLGLTYLMKGEPQKALAEFLQESSASWRLDGLVMAYHALGQKAQSDAALAELMQKFETSSSWNIAYCLAYRGEADRAFAYLEKAVQYHDSGLGDTAYMWAFANLHSDPRWLPFLRRIGRAPEQIAAIKLTLKLPKS